MSHLYQSGCGMRFSVPHIEIYWGNLFAFIKTCHKFNTTPQLLQLRLYHYYSIVRH